MPLFIKDLIDKRKAERKEEKLLKTEEKERTGRLAEQAGNQPQEAIPGQNPMSQPTPGQGPPVPGR